MSTLLNFTPQAPSSPRPSPDPKSICYALQARWASAFTQLCHCPPITTAEMKNVILKHTRGKVKYSLLVAISCVMIVVLITFWMNHWEEHWHIFSPNFQKCILFSSLWTLIFFLAFASKEVLSIILLALINKGGKNILLPEQCVKALI